MVFLVAFLTGAMLAAESAVFGLWKEKNRKIWICHAAVLAAGNLAALALAVLWKKKTACEYLLVFGLVSAVCAAAVSALAVRKEDRGQIILKAACLCCVTVALYATLTRGQAGITSDTASATLLARAQVRGASPFPAGWCYVNGEIWTIGLNLFTMPFTLLLRDQALARMLGTALCILTAAAAVVLMCRKLFRNDAWLLVVPLFLVFHGSDYVMNNQILYEGAYVSTMMWIALGTALYYAAAYRGGKHAFRLYVILCAVMCAGGIRFAAEQVIPLLGASLVCLYPDVRRKDRLSLEKEGKELARYAALTVLPALAGLGIHLWLRGWHTTNDSVSAMAFGSTADVWANLGRYFAFLFDTFGYIPGAALKSLNGAWNLAALALCAVVCFIIPAAQAATLKRETKETKFFFAFGMIHNLVIFIIFVFFGVDDSPRYLLSSVFVLMILSSRFIWDRYILPRKVEGRVWIAAFLAAAVLTCGIIVPMSRGWDERAGLQKEFNRTLSGMGLKKGYATYWHAYRNEVYSDLEIRYGGVMIHDERTIRPFRWMVDENVFRPEDCETFLLLTEQENAEVEAHIPEMFGEPKDAFVLSGYHIYVFSHDIAAEMAAP